MLLLLTISFGLSFFIALFIVIKRIMWISSYHKQFNTKINSICATTTVQRNTDDKYVYNENSTQFKIIKSISKYNIFKIGIQKIQSFLKQTGGGVSIFYFLLINIFFSTLGTSFLLITKRANFKTSIIIGSVVGIFLSYHYVDNLILKFKNKFLNEFLVAIDMIINAIKAGLTIERAFFKIAKDARNPVKNVFKKANKKIQTGTPAAVALQIVSNDLHIKEIKFLTTLVSIQQESGSQLSGLLTTLKDIISSRASLRMKLKAMISEVKTSAIIIGLLPCIFSLILYYINPSHFDTFFDGGIGELFFNIAISTFFLGIFVLWKMTQIRKL